MKQVTVQIVTYNSESFIRSCIESLNSQTHHNLEIRIIDNASQDSTSLIVKEYIEAGYPIHFIQNEVNKGFSVAHNQSLTQYYTEYVLILNPDVRLKESFISTIIESMETNQSIGIASGKLINSKNKIDSTGIIYNNAYRFFDRGQGEPLNNYLNEEYVFGVTGAAMMIRSECVNDLMVNEELFDEEFFAYKEDIDVCWRANILRWKVKYIPRAIAEHDRGWAIHTSRTQIPLFVRQHSYINRYFLLIKNVNRKDLLKRLPFVLVYDLTLIGYLFCKEYKVLKAWRTFFELFPSMLLKRREIKKKRN